MNTQASKELQEFHQFIGEKLSNGSADLSPEEALDAWRALHPDPDFLDEETAAIQEAIDDMENGDRGRPADEVIEELRQRIALAKQ